MKISEEITTQICEAIPAVTPALLDSVLAAAADGSQLIFSEGEGQTNVEGKTYYPDYLQLQISDAQVAMRLAQQLMNACADSMANGGVLRSPVTLLISGEAYLSE
jgi:hypothetical protein